jgi:hypothetical protein
MGFTAGIMRERETLSVTDNRRVQVDDVPNNIENVGFRTAIILVLQPEPSAVQAKAP